MSILFDIANKSLTAIALVAFLATAAINGGYQKILELENQRKQAVLQYIYLANIKQLTTISTRLDL